MLFILLCENKKEPTFKKLFPTLFKKNIQRYIQQKFYASKTRPTAFSWVLQLLLLAFNQLFQ